ncbi:MAG: radical SAM protein [Candidatus Margulisbacteria bacterium]|nr:radical SAM protein [Candidatus Margulisiibacteriota bacterium]
MLNFTYSRIKRLQQILYNILFFAAIGKHPAVKKALQIDITSKCNLRCQGCYHFSGPPVEDLDDESMLAFLETKARQGHKKLWIFGGEPTLRSNLFDQIDQWFLEVHVISNGQIKIDPKFNWRIWVSLDGPEEVNDAIRGAGTFKKVLDNYTGDKRVGLVMTVNRQNYQYIPTMVELVKQIKVRSLSFTFYSPCRGDINTDFAFQAEDLPKIESIVTGQIQKNSKYLMIDPATLKSLLYGKIIHPCWDNRCYFAAVLTESYSSAGKLRKCCVENVTCETCRILPPHQLHCLMVTRQAPWWQYVRK